MLQKQIMHTGSNSAALMFTSNKNNNYNSKGYKTNSECAMYKMNVSTVLVLHCC